MKEDVERILSELATILRKLDVTKFEAIQRHIKNANKVFITGSGRTGLMSRAFATRLVQFGKECHVVGDPTNPLLKEGDILIVCSGSGTNATSLLHARKAKQAGGVVIALTANGSSDLSKIAHLTCLLPMISPNDLSYGSVQPIGTIFEQTLLLALDLLILEMMKQSNKTAQDLWKTHSNLQ